MKKSQSRDFREYVQDIVTVYCDGTPDEPHDRFVIVQYWLVHTQQLFDDFAELDVVYMWVALPEWEYNGRRGRSQTHTLYTLDGKLAKQPLRELGELYDRGLLGSKVVLSCASPKCGYRRYLGQESHKALQDALDTVAAVKFPGIKERLAGDLGIAIDDDQQSGAGDEIEVRELVRRVEIIRTMMGDTPTN